MKILRLRRDDYLSEIKKIDEKVQKDISNLTKDSDVALEMKRLWEQKVLLDYEEIQNKSKNKIESIKKAFDKDKCYLRDREENHEKVTQFNTDDVMYHGSDNDNEIFSES